MAYVAERGAPELKPHSIRAVLTESGLANCQKRRCTLQCTLQNAEENATFCIRHSAFGIRIRHSALAAACLEQSASRLLKKAPATCNAECPMQNAEEKRAVSAL